MNIEQRIAQALPHDKCLHFIVGVLIFTATHFFTPLAIYVPLVLGVLKEIYDRVRGGDSSPGDIVATALGGVAGHLCSVKDLSGG